MLFIIIAYILPKYKIYYSEKFTKVFSRKLFAIFKSCLLKNYLLKFAQNLSNVFSTDDLLAIHCKILMG